MVALGSTPSQPCKCPLCCLAFVVVSTCSFVPPSVLLPSSCCLLVVEGVVIEWKWLAKKSESQAPQQTHHSSNSHQVNHANPQACYTTTKSHSSATHTHTKWRQARRQGWHKASVPQQSEAPTTMVFCHHTHTASATIKPASPKGTWCWCLWQGSCHSLTHHKGVVSHG